MAGNPNWRKGVSGNPGGRPKVVAEVKDLARQHTGDAIMTLATIMHNEEAPPAARVAAANALLDRGYGRAPQSLTVKGSIEQHIIEMIQGLDSRTPSKPKDPIH